MSASSDQSWDKTTASQVSFAPRNGWTREAKTHLFIRYQIVLRILANGVIPIPLEDENIGGQGSDVRS